tara:strand:+ start:735 stop:1064 length:330 start_codon:yes stop_codon:yes gene_type:complete
LKDISLIYILLISYLGLILRAYIDNILLVSFLSSLVYGVYFSTKKSNKFNTYFVLFFSAFTTFSGFIPSFFLIFKNGEYAKFFFLINSLIISNLMIMYIGSSAGKKSEK